MDANFAIGPIDWQLELAQGITDFYMDAKFVSGPVDWQLELEQHVTEFYVGQTLALLNHSTGI